MGRMLHDAASIYRESIIKNQVDRDEYDKEQKLLKAQNRISGTSRRERPRRADQQVYVPPHLRGKAATADHETEPETSSTSTAKDIKMRLEFVKQNGEVCELNIREGEDLKKVVSSFGRANGLDARLRDALYHRLSSAMKGRAA